MIKPKYVRCMYFDDGSSGGGGSLSTADVIAKLNLQIAEMQASNANTQQVEDELASLRSTLSTYTQNPNNNIEYTSQLTQLSSSLEAIRVVMSEVRDNQLNKLAIEEDILLAKNASERNVEQNIEILARMDDDRLDLVAIRSNTLGTLGKLDAVSGGLQAINASILASNTLLDNIKTNTKEITSVQVYFVTASQGGLNVGDILYNVLTVNNSVVDTQWFNRDWTPIADPAIGTYIHSSQYNSSSSEVLVQTISNLDGNSVLVRAGATRLVGWNVINPNSTPAYLNIYNATTANIGVTNRFRCIAIPTGASSDPVQAGKGRGSDHYMSPVGDWVNMPVGLCVNMGNSYLPTSNVGVSTGCYVEIYYSIG
jgi:hypothetical protein